MRLKLILPVLATMLVPLAAAFFKYPDTHIPPGFLVFPLNSSLKNRVLT